MRGAVDGVPVAGSTVSGSSASPEPAPSRAERRDITVVMITADAATDAVRAFVHDEIRRCGGVFAPGPGSTWCGYFGAAGRLPDHAERALIAVGAITRWAADTCPEAAIRVAMHSGEAVVSHGGEGQTVPFIEASVLDDCRRLAAATLPGPVVTVPGPGAAPPQLPQPPRLTLAPSAPTPFVGRTAELDVLKGLMDWVAHSGNPAFVCLLGASGIGKTRLLDELAHRVADDPTAPAAVLTASVAPGEHPDAARTLADLVRSRIGGPATPAETDRRLTEHVTAHRRTDLLPGLRQALGLTPATLTRPELAETCLALLGELAASGPMLLLLDDVHLMDDRLREHIAALTETQAGGPRPVLVVSAAEPAFVQRLSRWKSAHANAMRLALPGLADKALTRMLERLLGSGRLPVAGDELRMLIAGLEGNPRRAEEFAVRCLTGVQSGVQGGVPAAGGEVWRESDSA